MNKISQNGMKVTQTSDSIIVNGVEHKLPEYVKGNGSNRMTMINGRITINGFVFNPETGEFKRSFSLVWGLLLIGAVLAYLIFG